MRVIKGTPDPVIVDELSDELALHCGLPIFKIAERIRVELDRLCDQIEKTTGGRLFSYVVPFSTAIACGFKVANNQWANSLLMHIYHTESDYPLYSRSTLCGAVATASGDDDLSSMIDWFVLQN